MFICPICQKQFETEDIIVKHSLKCWKEKNPYHMSKQISQSPDIVTRKVSSDVLDFFVALQKGKS